MRHGENYPYEFVRYNHHTLQTIETSIYVIFGQSEAERHTVHLQENLKNSGQDDNGAISWFNQRASRRSPVLRKKRVPPSHREGRRR